MITYTEEKIFTKTQVEELFLSINWLSGRFPDRLFKALLNSSTVITAWDGDELVGLIRVLDDTSMMAYINYVLVKPSHQKMNIASTMLNIVKEKYKRNIQNNKIMIYYKSKLFKERRVIKMKNLQVINIAELITTPILLNF